MRTMGMLRRGFVPVAALLAVFGVSLGGDARDGVADIRVCAGIADASRRLACFDEAAKKLDAPRFAGRLTHITEPFAIAAPTRLRFQSDGAIFVLYLKNSTGQVVQNLHIGGGGEDSYVIATPGTYFLQVNGSEGWRIWLEPA